MMNQKICIYCGKKIYIQKSHCGFFSNIHRPEGFCDTVCHLNWTQEHFRHSPDHRHQQQFQNTERNKLEVQINKNLERKLLESSFPTESMFPTNSQLRELMLRIGPERSRSRYNEQKYFDDRQRQKDREMAIEREIERREREIDREREIKREEEWRERERWDRDCFPKHKKGKGGTGSDTMGRERRSADMRRRGHSEEERERGDREEERRREEEREGEIERWRGGFYIKHKKGKGGTGLATMEHDGRTGMGEKCDGRAYRSAGMRDDDGKFIIATRDGRKSHDIRRTDSDRHAMGDIFPGFGRGFGGGGGGGGGGRGGGGGGGGGGGFGGGGFPFPGIRNRGFTCYLSVCMQFLRQIQWLSNNCLRTRNASYINNLDFFCQMLDYPNCPQDANLVLGSLLRHINLDTTTQFTTRVNNICNCGKRGSIKTEMDNILFVHINQYTNLQHGIDDLKTDFVELYCDVCHENTQQMQSRYFNFGQEFLIITLMRFEFDNGIIKKKNYPVRVEYFISLSSARYELVGIISHKGHVFYNSNEAESLRGQTGRHQKAKLKVIESLWHKKATELTQAQRCHYIVHLKHQNNWFLYNDTEVSQQLMVEMDRIREYGYIYLFHRV